MLAQIFDRLQVEELNASGLETSFPNSILACSSSEISTPELIVSSNTRLSGVSQPITLSESHAVGQFLIL
jgi:hypothetical protein